MSELKLALRYPTLGLRDEPPNYRFLSRSEEDSRTAEIGFAFNQLATFLGQKLFNDEIVPLIIKEACREYIRDTFFYTPLSAGSHDQHLILVANVDDLEINLENLGSPQIWSGQEADFTDRYTHTGVLLPELPGIQKHMDPTLVIPDMFGYIFLNQTKKFRDLDIDVLRASNRSDEWQRVCDALGQQQQELIEDSHDELDTDISGAETAAAKAKNERDKVKHAYMEAEQGATHQIHALIQRHADEEAARLERRQNLNEKKEHKSTASIAKKPKIRRTKPDTDPQIEAWTERLKLLATQITTCTRKMSALYNKINHHQTTLNNIKISENITTVFLDKRIAKLNVSVEDIQQEQMNAQKEKEEIQKKIAEYKSFSSTFYTNLSSSAEKRDAHRQYWELRYIHEEFSQRVTALASRVAAQEKHIERARRAIQETEAKIASREEAGDYKVISHGMGRAKRKEDYKNLAEQKLAFVPLLLKHSSHESRLTLIYKHAVEAAGNLADFIEKHQPQDRPFAKNTMREIHSKAKKHVYRTLNPRSSEGPRRTTTRRDGQEQLTWDEQVGTPEAIHSRQYWYLLRTNDFFKRAANEATKKHTRKQKHHAKVEVRLLRIKKLIQTKEETGKYLRRTHHAGKSISLERDTEKLMKVEDAFLEASQELSYAQTIANLVHTSFNTVMDELTWHIGEYGEARLAVHNPVNVDIKRRARADVEKSLERIGQSARRAVHFLYSNDH